MQSALCLPLQCDELSLFDSSGAGLEAQQVATNQDQGEGVQLARLAACPAAHGGVQRHLEVADDVRQDRRQLRTFPRYIRWRSKCPPCHEPLHACSLPSHSWDCSATPGRMYRPATNGTSCSRQDTNGYLDLFQSPHRSALQAHQVKDLCAAWCALAPQRVSAR